MTAITTKAFAQPADEAAYSRKDASPTRVRAPRKSCPPSATEEEARARFVSALTEGVDTLLDRGHGRERASVELLSEIAQGCPPNEDEIFQTMESLGISLEDATKVMTISAAFRNAKMSNDGSAAGAIDDLTSRLNLADLSHKGGRSPRSPSPSPSGNNAPTPPPPSTPSNLKATEESNRNESAGDSSQARAAKKGGHRPAARAGKSHPQGGRGRKRALAEKNPEGPGANVMMGDPKDGAGAKADLVVEEKMRNAKLSKAEGNMPNPSLARAKSPEGGVGRGKRAAATVLHVEESQPGKRPRTRSQTEESIPAI